VDIIASIAGNRQVVRSKFPLPQKKSRQPIFSAASAGGRPGGYFSTDVCTLAHLWV